MKFISKYILAITVAFVLQSNTNTADASKVSEIQRSIHREQRQAEILQDKLDKAEHELNAEVSSIQAQIDTTIKSMANMDPGSKQIVKAKEYLTDLLANKHIKEHQHYADAIGTTKGIIQRILSMEKFEEQKGALNGSRNYREVSAWKNKMLTRLDSSLQTLEHMQRGVASDMNHSDSDPHFDQYLAYSKESITSVRYDIASLLKANSPQQRANSDDKLSLFKYKVHMETMLANLKTKYMRSTDILIAIKRNAELQAASLMARLIQKSIDRRMQSRHAEYDSQGGNFKSENDWNEVNMTRPN